MSELLALPAHQPAEGKAFDAAADAAEMDALPLQDYSSHWTQEQAGADQTGPTPPEGEEPPVGGETEEPTGNAETNAREFLEAYDVLQSYAFHFYSGGKPAEDFTLPKFAKDRAAHHLAKGLEKMGSPELPWWLGLLIVLAPPSVMNWMAAKEFRKAAEAKANAETTTTHRKANPTAPITPDSITRADGTTIQVQPSKPQKERPVHGECEECGSAVHRKGRRFCSQSCSGKHLAKTRAAKATKP